MRSGTQGAMKRRWLEGDRTVRQLGRHASTEDDQCVAATPFAVGRPLRAEGREEGGAEGDAAAFWRRLARSEARG